MRAVRANLGAALCLSAALAVAGCGVPTDGAVGPITAVPYDLLSPTTAAGPTPSPSRSVGPFVYLVRDDLLVRVQVQGVGGDVVATTADLLSRLASGPTKDDRTSGLATALGPDVRLTLTGVDRGTAVVDVQAGDQAPSPGRLPLAVGQIVLTAGSVPGVDRVVLTAGGTPIEAPLPGGALTARPLVPTDYAVLRAPQPSAPTPSPATTTP